MKKPVTDLIGQMKPAFQMALGSQQMAERFARVALTQVRTTPRLGECSSQSLMGALMMAAQLKLEFNLGSAYIIPYWSGKTGSYEAQFQIGYLGYIDLFYRHPLAAELYAEVVHENDEFKIRKGTSREIIHNPDLNDPGNAIGYYAVAKLKTGAQNFVYMSVKEVTEHMLRTPPDKSGKRGAWDTYFDQMALKTVIKKVLKIMPKSIEMASAIEIDEAIKRPPTVEMAKHIDELPTIYPEELSEVAQYASEEDKERLIAMIDDLGYSDADVTKSVQKRLGIECTADDWRASIVATMIDVKTLQKAVDYYRDCLETKGAKK